MDNEILKKIGVTFIEDFISKEEEEAVLSKIGPSKNYNTSKHKTKNKKNRNFIRRYGSAEPYGGNIVSTTIPDFLKTLSEKIVASGLLEKEPNSITINEYLQGQEITPHIDSPKSGKVITIVSLLGSANMILSYKSEKISIFLPPRSLIQLSKESREKWNHAIEPVPDRRYSIVFRDSTFI